MTDMKKQKHSTMTLLSMVIALAAGILPASGQMLSGLRVENTRLERSDDGSRLTVTMDLRLGDLDLDHNHTAVIVPVLVKGEESRLLKPVSVYGRNRWFQALRADGVSSDGILHSDRPELLSYSDAVPYEDWMDGANLELRRSDYGCCERLSSKVSEVLGYYAEPPVPEESELFVPEFRYVRPEAKAVKISTLSGRAYIDFPSGKTEIIPSYSRNRVELSKIAATIDSVRNDADITVMSITIKGYASPEGKYEANERLAQGRTEALKEYVQRQYAFPGELLKTDYVAEDWDGLRDYVEKSMLTNRTELLAIIDDPELDPDTKDGRMKLRYPAEYAQLLKEAYPGLRHSDYRIEYTVRHYEDTEEIARIMRTTPQKLSLEELFVLAQTLEPGSEDYAEVYETAVHLYPGDETANLNAANAAMQRGDLEGAERYLSRAGGSAEAEYARGILSRLKEESARTDR